LLQPRDRRLIAALGQVRFIDRHQASMLAPFRSESRAKARMLALVRAGYLHQVFVGTINGGRKAVFSLPTHGRSRRPFRPLTSPKTERFIEHHLAVSEVYAQFALATDGNGSAPQVTWRSINAPLSHDFPIIPDGLVEVATAQGVCGMFVEVDLGTESLRVWVKKVRAYLALARSGRPSAFSGASLFRVLVIAEGSDRLDALRRTASARSDRVFWFADLNIIKRDGIWSQIWLRPTGDQLHALQERKESYEVLQDLPSSDGRNADVLSEVRQ
jgi:protein involved in plasmid replication-relaxation